MGLLSPERKTGMVNSLLFQIRLDTGLGSGEEGRGIQEGPLLDFVE
jgi:hypothetical protein